MQPYAPNRAAAASFCAAASCNSVFGPCAAALFAQCAYAQANVHTLEAKDELARVSAEIVGRFNRIDAFEEEWKPVLPLTRPASARARPVECLNASMLQPCCNMLRRVATC